MLGSQSLVTALAAVSCVQIGSAIPFGKRQQGTTGGDGLLDIIAVEGLGFSYEELIVGLPNHKFVAFEH